MHVPQCPAGDGYRRGSGRATLDLGATIPLANSSPLALPRDTELLSAFLGHFGLKDVGEPTQLLRQVVAAFAHLPYENLTKIIRDAEEGDASRARRPPREVWTDHQRLGAGGTCFSLTATLLYLL